jgi:hypothetical protein
MGEGPADWLTAGPPAGGPRQTPWCGGRGMAAIGVAVSKRAASAGPVDLARAAPRASTSTSQVIPPKSLEPFLELGPLVRLRLVFSSFGEHGQDPINQQLGIARRRADGTRGAAR